MRLLLDTHVVLWWLGDMPDLSTPVRDAIAEPRNAVYVSAVTIWEIVIKRSLRKLEIPDEWSDVLAEEPFRKLPVTWTHALRVRELPELHRDPFDRLLIAQALAEDLTLVTRDDVANRYGVATLMT